MPGQDGRADSGAAGLGQRLPLLLLETNDRVARKKRDQQQARHEARQEEPPERDLRRHGIEQHGDGRWQQDAKCAARSDDTRGKAARIAARAHFGDAGRTDRRAGGGGRPRHRCEQAAGDRIGNAEATGHTMQPGMQGQIEIAARIGTPDRRPLQNEKRDRQDDRVGELLIEVLRDRIDRGQWHEQEHEGQRRAAKRECDGHAREHQQQRDNTVSRADNRLRKAGDKRRRRASPEQQHACESHGKHQ